MKTIILFFIVLLPVVLVAQQRTVSDVYDRFIPVSDTIIPAARYLPGPEKVCFGNALPVENSLFEAYYDLRQHGWVSPVRNKGACGCCYAFAAMASIESAWLKNSWGEADFSEEHIRSCHGFVMGAEKCCSGGDIYKAGAYLSRHSGPLDEQTVPYTALPDISCNTQASPTWHINQFRILPPDIAVIKQALLDNGAIYSAMYYDDPYYRENDHTYYYSGTRTENHAVLIAGWDDNKPTAGGQGAWIVKNDFGTGWGENGYFYVSYSDSRMLSSNGYFTGRTPAYATAMLYMYDQLGFTSSTGWNDATAYGLVKFISAGQWPVRRLGTFVNTSQTQLEIKIYDHFNGNQLSGLLAEINDLTCPFPGYYVFDLPYPVFLFAGNDFYVHVKYYTPGNNNPVPTEKAISGYALPQIETASCWISHTGSQWTPLGADASLAIDKIDLCIRAYALPYPLALENTELQTFITYPNPAKDYITIGLAKSSKNNMVEIFNATGKRLFQSEIEEEIQFKQIDISNFEPGYYFIRIINTKGAACKSFIVE